MQLSILLLLVFGTPFVLSENECETTEDCEMTGSVCSKNACVCPQYYIADSLHTKCLLISGGYGSGCEDNVQCSEGLKSGGICKNGTCACLTGYHYFLGQCWKSAGLGENCKRNENCFVNNDFEAGTCSEKKICECSPGYYQREYSSCRRASYSPGDPCGIALDCKFDGAVCSMNRTCQVAQSSKTHYQANTLLNAMKEIHSNELPSVNYLSTKVGEACKSNSNCPKNSECNLAKVCSCLKGFYTNIDNATCYPELGAACQRDDDCVGKNTQCRNGTVCVCKQGFVTSHDGRYCDKLSRDLGWSCLRDEQCSFFGPHSLCLRKKCNCDSQSHFVQKELYCWISKNVGEGCVGDADCGGGEAVCSGGTCRCRPGSHPVTNNTDCRKDSPQVGGSCCQDIDCTFPSSYCNNLTQVCDCLKGYINANGSCIPGVGGVCSGNEDCTAAEGSSCVNKTCGCPEGFTGNSAGTRCLPLVRQINETCTEDVQCALLESSCVGGRCTCWKGSHYVENSQCFISKYIGQPCSFLGNCSLTPHSLCQGFRCQCRPGYRPNHSGTMCSSGASFATREFSIIILLLGVLIVFI